MASIVRIEELPHTTEMNDYDRLITQKVGEDTTRITATTFAKHVLGQIINLTESSNVTEDTFLIGQETGETNVKRVALKKLFKFLQEYLASNAENQASVVDALKLMSTNPVQGDFMKVGISSGAGGVKTWISHLEVKNAKVAGDIYNPSDPAHIMELLSVMPKPVENKTFFHVEPYYDGYIMAKPTSGNDPEPFYKVYVNAPGTSDQRYLFFAQHLFHDTSAWIYTNEHTLYGSYFTISEVKGGSKNFIGYIDDVPDIKNTHIPDQCFWRCYTDGSYDA